MWATNKTITSVSTAVDLISLYAGSTWHICLRLCFSYKLPKNFLRFSVCSIIVRSEAQYLLATFFLRFSHNTCSYVYMQCNSLDCSPSWDVFTFSFQTHVLQRTLGIDHYSTCEEVHTIQYRQNKGRWMMYVWSICIFTWVENHWPIFLMGIA
jgi:hypothetical protein